MNDTCYLSLYGYHVFLYDLGDRYDIFGLRQHSCKCLKQTFTKIGTASWEDRLIIFDMMYRLSRVNDELRTMLIDMIYECTGGGWGDYLMTWEHGPKLLLFLDRSPELAGPILRRTLENTWAVAQSWRWGPHYPSSPPPPRGGLTRSPSGSDNQT